MHAQFIRSLKDNYIREQLFQHEQNTFKQIVERADAIKTSKTECKCKTIIIVDINKIDC